MTITRLEKEWLKKRGFNFAKRYAAKQGDIIGVGFTREEAIKNCIDELLK